MNRNGKIAISEIIILLIGVIAIAYAIGGGIESVSAAGGNTTSALSTISLISQGAQLTGLGGGGSSSMQTPTPAGYPTWGIGGLFETGEAQTFYQQQLTSDSGWNYFEHLNSQWQEAESEADRLTQVWIDSANKPEVNSWEAFEAQRDAHNHADDLKDQVQKEGSDLAGKHTDAQPGAWSTFFDGAVSSLSYGLTAYAASALILELFGADESYKNSIPPALGVAFFAGRAAYLLSGQSAALGIGVGALTFALVFAANYKEEQFKVTTYNCYSWKAPVGGKDCHLCNEQNLPCSDYQCRSLGQACQLLNDEDSGEQFCAWINSQDVQAPTIKVRSEALLRDFAYSNDGAISPPDKGVIVGYTGNTEDPSDKCIPAFTPLTFGIITVDKDNLGPERDEPAICRVDTERVSFENMRYAFEYPEKYRVNHTFTISLPSLQALEEDNLTLENDGNMSIYVKCMDANGNENENDFLFRFCVQKGPDTQPPYLVGSSISNGMPVAQGQTSIENFTIYMNEPVECRWSFEDREYEWMVNEMECDEGATTFNTQLIYRCKTNLTGIKDKEINKYYFKCIDQPNWSVNVAEGERNINTQDLFYPEEFTIIGTQPLVLESVGPNGTIRDSATAVKVTLTAKTLAGYKDGEAVCSYKGEDNEQFIDFFSTNSYQHSTDLYLPEGEYSYTIRCVDLGGNSDEGEVSFNTISDNNAPQVVRVYKEETFLKITTDEEATCVYSTQGSDYPIEEGIPMTKDDKNNHYTEWVVNKKFHIKCSDEYGNQPAPDESTIIIIPIE